MLISNKTDLSLLHDLRADSVQAYEEIFLRYSERLYTFSLKYLKDTVIAEEVMMDVMFWLWQNRETLDKVEDLPAYLFKAVRNKVFNHFRKTALQTVSFDDLPHMFSPKSTAPADEALELDELRSRYKKCLELLNPQCRNVFILSREEQLSHAEISARLNISTKTVEGHITTALKIYKMHFLRHSPLYVFFSSLSFF